MYGHISRNNCAYCLGRNVSNHLTCYKDCASDHDRLLSVCESTFFKGHRMSPKCLFVCLLVCLICCFTSTVNSWAMARRSAILTILFMG